MHPVAIGIIVTAGFLVLGLLGKSVARGWDWKDAYLGMEMTLTSISGAVLLLFEMGGKLAKLPQNSAGTVNAEVVQMANQLQQDGLFLVIALILFFGIACLHRSWEGRGDVRYQRWILAGAANTIGAILLVSFIVVIKRGF